LPAGNATGGWVIGMYETVLGRRPSPAELSVWEKAISSNQLTGLQAAFGFIESSERLATIIGGLYEQYLGRAADADGIDYWTGIWRTNGGEEQVQAGIIGSPEYYAFAGRQYPHLS